MTYGKMSGVDKDVSKIVMGTLFASELDAAAPVFDYFIEQGGNCFDTARHYGIAELVFSRWLRS